MYPLLSIDLSKLKHNLDALNEMCHARGISTAIVTKVFCADPRIVDVINASSAEFIADSRVENLESIKTDREKMLLRISMPCEVERVVRCADISLQSEISTIRLLGAAAKKAQRLHKVVIMIDLGDLREGIFFENRDEIFDTVKAVMDESNLVPFGIGTNLTCYGGILPDENNLGELVKISREIRGRFGIELPFVSGGNSSSLTMLLSDRIPSGINNLRLGESFTLSNDTSTGLPVSGLYDDAFVLKAQIVELKRKPSKPMGTSGMNAFGETVSFEDKGEMLRAILAIGRQDVDADGLRPLDEKIDIIGASSDHLIVDLTKSSGYNVGDVLDFIPAYGALLRLCTSKYVKREYVE